MKKISIRIGDHSWEASLNSSQTARLIWEALPCSNEVHTWGEEIYFEVPVTLGLEKEWSREVVALGDLAYWPQGKCFCVFFGKTPMSQGEDIRPASAVNVFGTVGADLEALKSVREGQGVVVERKNESVDNKENAR